MVPFLSYFLAQAKAWLGVTLRLGELWEAI